MEGGAVCRNVELFRTKDYQGAFNNLEEGRQKAEEEGRKWKKAEEDGRRWKEEIGKS